ncbi:MAG: DNRLRE domain-containing protein [Promethearchaeota archaeon]
MRRDIYKYVIIIMVFNLNFILLLTPALAYIETKPFRAVENATIYAENPNTNYGGASELEVGHWTNWTESFIKFDLSNAPINFSKAELKIEFISVEVDTLLLICKTTNDWSENNITWNSAPSKGISITMINITKEVIYAFDVSYTFDLTSTNEYKTRYWSICLTSYGLTSHDNIRIKMASKQCISKYTPPRLIFYYNTSDFPILLPATLLVLAMLAGILGLSWNVMRIKAPKKQDSQLNEQPQIGVQQSETLTKKEGIKYCIKCGYPNKKDNTFCEECGTKMPF